MIVKYTLNWNGGGSGGGGGGDGNGVQKKQRAVFH